MFRACFQVGLLVYVVAAEDATKFVTGRVSVYVVLRGWLPFCFAADQDTVCSSTCKL